LGFFESFVALRLLRGVKQQKGFLSLSTFISMAGVAIGVMALIVVIGVMTGFELDMKKKILGVTAHIIVLKSGEGLADAPQVAAKIKDIPGIVSVAPFIYTQVMFAAPGNMSGGVLRGLDSGIIARGGPQALEVKQGKFADLAGGGPEEAPRIAIGNEMAQTLNLKVGDYLNIISPRGPLTAMGRLPRSKAFRIAAIFSSGMYEFDSTLVYTSIPALQQFLGLDHLVTGLEVGVQDINAAGQVAMAIQKKLGPPFYTRNWMQMNRSLFAALKLQKVTLFIILTLIILVAAFGIASTLFMMVMRKTRDIAILKSMGATRQSIMRIFVINGLVIGGLGTFTGLALGLGLCGLLKEYQFIELPREIYFISTLPVTMQATDLLAIIAAAMAISLLATLYPSWLAARQDPVEAIRYE
jgi:lipoprotein-releasing system permease protein